MLLRVGVCVAVAVPCIWDSDTLADELRGLPDAHDLIVGRWHRHGDAYYRARIDRLGGRADLTLAEYDDLAVAHEFVGERDEAIAVMQRKGTALREAPDQEHLYRYYANLGTFLAHAGRFDEALVELRRAVALNPDAHFGRERYQIELIEYVAAAKADPSLWARHGYLAHAGWSLGSRLFPTEGSGERELDPDAAYTATAGMLRFGGLEGPELYRSLADLFLHRQHLNLAWWALQRAVERGHPAKDRLVQKIAAIEKHWREASKHTRKANPIPTIAQYREARIAADHWLAEFQRVEAAALRAGEDVASDAVLRRLLAEADRAAPRPQPQSSWFDGMTRRDWGAVLAALALLLFAWRFVLLRRSRRVAAARTGA